jgi:hypothetical protein
MSWSSADKRMAAASSSEIRAERRRASIMARAIHEVPRECSNLV